MALHVLRRVHHATLQQQGEHAGPLPGLAPVEADPSPNGNAREDLQEPDLGVLVPVADRPAVRRDPPRRPCRRHLAQAQLRRPDRVHGGARRRLAPGQERELAGVGGPHGAHCAARRRRDRRRQRVEKARRAVWPETKVQRCTFHAFEQVKRCTTTRPRTQAGVDLYAIAKGLLKVGTPDAAAEWLAEYAKWCSDYEGFLEEREVADGRPRYKHERLRKARRGLTKLCREGVLFTYLDEALAADGAVPATNNRIEGGVNRQIRAMLNEHRGMRLDRMVKAAFWYCNSRLEAPASPARALAELPTDEAIAELRRTAAEGNARDEAVERWGTAVSWSDLHSGGPYRSDWD